MAQGRPRTAAGNLWCDRGFMPLFALPGAALQCLELASHMAGAISFASALSTQRKPGQARVFPQSPAALAQLAAAPQPGWLARAADLEWAPGGLELGCDCALCLLEPLFKPWSLPAGVSSFANDAGHLVSWQPRRGSGRQFPSRTGNGCARIAADRSNARAAGH